MGRAHRRVTTEEEVRRRLARALHDDHCQRAAALGFELRAVRAQLAEDDPRRLQLDSLSRQLAELGEDLRRLSHDLHPAILEHRGLAAALRDHCAEVEERHGVRVELDLPANPPPIPREVDLAMYRIAQEGLANLVRHAGAKTARLELRASAGAVRLTLSDSGAGLNLHAARQAGGLGIASMEERARLLGGRCRIVSAVGAGTTIEASVPRRPLSRWLRRHWGWVAAVALVVLALGGGLAATWVQAQRTAAQAQRAEAAVHFLEELFSSADPQQANGEALDARNLLQRGRERLDSELADQPLLRAQLLETLGRIHTTLGLYDEAQPLLTEALTLREQLHGSQHPEVAATLCDLGALAHASGQGDATALFRRALAMYEAAGMRESPAVADLLNDLGTVLAAQGQLDDAETILQQSLALHEKLVGTADPKVARVLHNLAGIAYYRNQPAVMEARLVRALAIREAALPEDNLELAGSREALALLRHRQGRPAEAVVLLAKQAATLERVYGPEHPQLARVLLNLGMARDDLGDSEAAGELFARALAINEQALAPEHPQLLRSLAALAGHHLRQGRYHEAEPLYQRLLAVHARGGKYEGWDRTLQQWQKLLAATGRTEQASAGTHQRELPP